MIEIDNYDLIGIGEFSYGFEEIWDFRYKLLKRLIFSSRKKITLFLDITSYQAHNIQYSTYRNEDNKLIDYDEIKFEGLTQKNKHVQPKGMLHNYVSYLLESKTFYKFIKYIRKHQSRINIVGLHNHVDNHAEMYDKIKKHLCRTRLNLIFAHNNIIDSRKNKDHTSCGYYLKNKLREKYCIILSQAEEGELRFCGFYLGHKFKYHVWYKEYFYHRFKYHKYNRLYTKLKNPYHILTHYCGEFMEFGDGYYECNNYGHDKMVTSHTWDFVLYWHVVTKLIPMAC